MHKERVMRLLPRSSRGAWLLAGAVWLTGTAGLWLLLPIWPRASWPTAIEQETVGFVPGTHTFVTRSAPPRGTDGGTLSDATGPLTFWDAETGQSHSWFT